MKNFTTSLLAILICLSAICSESCASHNKPSQHKEGYIEVKKGGKLYYQTFGQGTPIIMLHGQPANHSQLLPQMSELAKSHEITFYDQRGFGKSQSGTLNDTTINIPTYIEDLETLRKSLGYNKFILIGHSWGGRLAMEYAVKYQSNLSNLIILNSNPASYQGQVDFMNEFMNRIKPIEKELTNLFDYESYSKLSTGEIINLHKILLATYFYNPKDVEKLTISIDKQTALNEMNAYNIMAKTAFLQKGYDLKPKLNKVKVPALVLHGDHDVVPVSAAQEITKAIPHTKLVVLKNCGHYPYIEKSKEFFYELEKFLQLSAD